MTTKTKWTVQVSTSQTTPWAVAFTGSEVQARAAFVEQKDQLPADGAVRLVDPKGTAMLLSFGAPKRVGKKKAPAKKKR